MHVNISQEPLQREFTAKMPRPSLSPERGHTLCASMCSRNVLTFHKSHFIRKFTGKVPQTSVSPECGHTLCASLRSRNACRDCTRATSYGNSQEEGSRPEQAPWSSTGLYTYRKNPLVWTHCLGKKVYIVYCHAAFSGKRVYIVESTCLAFMLRSTALLCQRMPDCSLAHLFSEWYFASSNLFNVFVFSFLFHVSRWSAGFVWFQSTWGKKILISWFSWHEIATWRGMSHHLISARALRPLSLDLQLLTNLSKHLQQRKERSGSSCSSILVYCISIDGSCAGRPKGFQIFVECLRSNYAVPGAKSQATATAGFSHEKLSFMWPSLFLIKFG